jgi:two-component system cell cycle sensor histidine kinase/response regulator CckA
MQTKPLKSSENNFLALLNFIADPAVIVDEKGCIRVVNAAFESSTGLRQNDVIGKLFLELGILAAESKAILLENLKKRMQGLAVQPYEITFTAKSGEIKYVEVKAKKLTYAGKSADLVLFRDITRRKRNLAKLKKYSEQMEALVDEKTREIKENAEKLRSIFDSSPDAITILDLKGKIIDCNQAKLRIHGFSSKKELVGKNLLDLVSPKYREKAASCMSDIVTTELAKNSEYLFLSKDGKAFPVECAAGILRDAMGKPIGYISLTKAITRRKQVETKLREAEKRYRALFDQAPLGILLISPETAKAVRFNEEAHRQLGYSREEFAELTVSDYEVFESPEDTRARMKRILKTGRDEFETKHRTKTGEIRDVINTVRVIELAGKKFFHLVTRDITEQKKMENELKLERDKLEAVTENIGAGLVMINRDYTVLWANDFMKRFRSDAEGKLCYAALHNSDTVCANCGVRKVFEKGVVIDAHEYNVPAADGKPTWVEIIATPIKDKDGNLIAALELVVDITEKKLLQSELAEYSQKLKQLVEERTEQLKQTQTKLLKAEKLAAIGELAGMVGHDLRNPLTGIKGATYYLKNKYAAEIGATGKEMLSTIENAIDHANKIINDLLEYSSKLSLELEETTPKSLLTNALSSIEVPERIRIIDATEGKPKIKADIGNVQKVFVNIINNAMDAMPETGTLTITSHRAEDNLAVTFKDTGIGMTKETLSKLKLGFPLFTTKAKGMGFGLPICKRIIEAHGGKISLQSTLGKGTTVTITIPVNPHPSDASEEKWIFNEAALRGLHVSHKAS